MKLYQVMEISLNREALSFTVSDTKNTDGDVMVNALVETDESYKNTDAFLKHIRENGEKYAGHTWVLVSAKSKEIRVSVSKQYKIQIGENSA